MTLENCKRLLAHYREQAKNTALGDGARARMHAAAADMEAHLAKRGGSPKK